MENATVYNLKHVFSMNELTAFSLRSSVYIFFGVFFFYVVMTIYLHDPAGMLFLQIIFTFLKM